MTADISAYQVTRADAQARRRAQEKGLQQWVGLIHRVLDSSASEMGLLLHEYSGRLSDRIELLDDVHLPVVKVNNQFLYALQPDRFYFIQSE